METTQSPRLSIEFNFKSGKAVPEKCWLSSDVNPITTFEDIYKMLLGEAEKIANKIELKVEVSSQPIQPIVPAQLQPIHNTPQCPKCGSSMKLNKKGDYWNCVRGTYDTITKTRGGCLGYMKVV